MDCVCESSEPLVSALYVTTAISRGRINPHTHTKRSAQLSLSRSTQNMFTTGFMRGDHIDALEAKLAGRDDVVFTAKRWREDNVPAGIGTPVTLANGRVKTRVHFDDGELSLWMSVLEDDVDNSALAAEMAELYVVEVVDPTWGRRGLARVLADALAAATAK